MTGLATLTALHWGGDPPVPGQYLKAERGRTAFLIVEVVPPRRPCGYAFRLLCERTSPANLPAGAVVHTWRWAAR